jgi:cytochrome c oxidase subunit 2
VTGRPTPVDRRRCGGWRGVRRRGSAVGGAAAVLTAGFALSGCRAPTILLPRSQDARQIAALGIVLLVIAAFIFIVVEGLLLLSLLRFRRRKASDTEQVYGNTGLEVLWTVIPAIIVTVLFVLTVRTMADIQLAEGQVPVNVTGHQFWWQFEYPEGGFFTANEMHVPSDRSLELQIRAADVIHSFWAPQLGGKTDAIPGRTNHMSITKMTVGKYLGECAEFCGAQHARMRFWLVVDTPKAYAAWFRNQQLPAAPPTSADQKAGKAALETQACIGCHTIRGTAAAGMVGPDLTHVGSRSSLAAGTLKNTPPDMELWIADPQKVKPGNAMPKLPLTAAQIRLISAYLEGLR